MSYKGRYILGDVVPLSCRCVDAGGSPAEPSAAPVALVSSDSALVASVRLPVRDRYAVTGYFQYPLRLDSSFAAGNYRVAYQWSVGGTAYGAVESFEVVAGGQADGAGLALYYFRRPTSDFILLQCDSGRIVRRRNPRL